MEADFRPQPLQAVFLNRRKHIMNQLHFSALHGFASAQLPVSPTHQKYKTPYNQQPWFVCGIFIFLMLAAPFAHSTGTPALPADYRPCNADAYSIDPDESGTNIRRHPSAQSPVLRKINTQGHGFDVHITGYASGWFQINKASDPTEEDKTLFKGNGWIHASLLGADGMGSGTRLFSAPSLTAKKTGLVRVNEGATLKSCSGKWLEVKNSTNGKIGWAAPGTLCINSLTTCP